ncbi:MAG: hypothetical protein K8W52_46840 [Deltaproteobacteria bacterium]|nr:hypothetical protein [Deltaproteobacteria bacterium]
MASDVRLRIIDPAREAVVVVAWIGGNGTRDRARDVLQRPPDFAVQGWESWGSISAAEALAIAEARYAPGASTDDVRRWLDQYPTATCSPPIMAS